MATVFSMIIAGELPAHFVHRDDSCVAFLSINPITHGHTLVVPVEETDHWLDLPPSLNAHLMAVAQRIGVAQQQAFSPQRVGLMIAGFEVPHVHVHVLPVNDLADFSFANAAANPDPADLEAAATAIRAALAEGPT